MTTNSIIENRLTKSCPGTSPGAFWGTPLRAKRLKKEKNNRHREQKPMCAQQRKELDIPEHNNERHRLQRNLLSAAVWAKPTWIIGPYIIGEDDYPVGTTIQRGRDDYPVKVLGMPECPESSFKCLVTSEVTRTQDPHQQM
jgi:hypothetical protein